MLYLILVSELAKCKNGVNELISSITCATFSAKKEKSVCKSTDFFIVIGVIMEHKELFLIKIIKDYEFTKANIEYCNIIDITDEDDLKDEYYLELCKNLETLKSNQNFTFEELMKFNERLQDLKYLFYEFY